MSEEKLNFQQKLFAVVEGMVKETKIREIRLDMPVAAEELAFAMTAGTGSLDLEVPAVTQPLETTITPRVTGAVESLNNPPVLDAGITALEAVVKDEEITAVRVAAVHDADVRPTTRTVDFFEQFGVDKKIKYSTAVKAVHCSGPKTVVHHPDFAVYPTLADNLELFKRFTVEKKPIVLSYLSEKEQLLFWKKAVKKTRKDPKSLRLLGVYTGLPRRSIEGVKLNMNTLCLNYNFKTSFGFLKKEEPLEDVALFQDMETARSVMVSK